MNGTQTGGIEVAPTGEEAPRQIGGYRQLFLDDSVVAYRMNVRREFNQVEKASFNPIIRCDKPWEREGDGYYIERMCTAFDEREGVHKMWYETVNTFENPPADEPEHTTYTCYATSSDGVHWEKPDLGLVSYRGSTANNLIPFEGTDRHLTRLVEVDPNEPDPSRRYKGLHRASPPERVWLPKYSADGFHWTVDVDHPTDLTFEDDCVPVMWDPQAQRWVFYRRMRRCLERLTGSKDTIVRMAGVSVSQGRDISRWHPKTRGHMVLAPDERDAAEAERRGAMWCEHYTMFGWPYEGLWLAGLEELWRSIDWVEVTGRLSHVEGYEDMHLAWSRDLIDWQRKADREPWIPTGRPGEWDSGMIYGISRPVIQGDELWFYYDGFDGTHFDPGCFGNMPRWQEWMQAGDAAGRPHLHEWRAWNAMQGAVGLAKLRLDGFAHLEALAVPGILITKPLLMTGRGLGINAAVAGGEVRVEIQDEAGTPIDGHGLDDCDRFVGDSVRHEVTWRGSGDLGGLQGRVVRLHFWLRLANLYSFYLVDGGQSEPSPAQRVTDALEAMPMPEVKEAELPPWLRSTEDRPQY